MAIARNKIDLAELDDALVYIPNNFKIIDKDEQLVRMELRPIQVDFIKRHGVRNLVLKARQVGMSSGVLACNAHKFFTRPYQRMAVITHDQKTSEFLLDTIHRFYRNLPGDHKPEADLSSVARLRLPKLDNFIYIESAQSEAVGIGRTLSRVHISELARWPDKKARQLWADITQTVPLTASITAESTPRGRAGLFYELWTAAKRNEIPYQTFFYPWWWEPGYRIAVESPLKLSKDEQGLVETYGLDQEQIAFRRLKQRELKDLFFQEYPESDIDCWLSNDIGVVDPLTIKPYFAMVREGTVEGALTIWKGPVGGRRYVVGIDVAAGYSRGDFSVASVLDVRTMEYVARLRGHIPPDMFGEQVFNLGKRYNNALLGVEKTGHGHTVLRILLEKNYSNLYYRTEYDDFQNSNITEVGWHTNVKTKPMMITDLVAAFRSQDLISWSENLLEEASALVWATDRKVEKTGGMHDDEWDAVSIALQIREQTPVIEETRTPVTYYAR